jgi:hypothetical protein
MHAFEARSWQEKLDADPTDEDARMEVADETRRSRDMAALADALDALAEAVKGCGQDYRTIGGYFQCGDSTDTTIYLCGKCEVLRDASIHTLTDSPTP